MPSSEHQLRSYAHGATRGERWIRGLSDAAAARIALSDLYVGDHWAVARAIGTTALAKGWAHASLWAASAGVGLAAATTKVPPYGATFASPHEDSVVDATAGATAAEQRRAWWSEITAETGSSLLTVARSAPQASFVFLGSRAYLDAVEGDLSAALAVLREPERFVIVSSTSIRGPLAAHTIGATANMRARLGGALPSLHARLARHIVAHLAPASWSSESARKIADAIRRDAVLPALPVRATLSDADVVAFITGRLRDEAALSATRLLRELRTSGRACEQGRFRTLYDSVPKTTTARAAWPLARARS